MLSAISKQLSQQFKSVAEQGFARYIGLVTWSIVLLTIIASFKNFQLSAIAQSDELYYYREVAYLSSYGLYNSLAQGTSFVYSAIVFTASKLLSIDFLLAAKLLSILFFALSCGMLVKCLGVFKDIGRQEKYFSIAVFCVLCKFWLWKGLPDLICCFLILSAFYLATRSKMQSVAAGGFVLFLAFATKPVALFVLPFMTLIPLFHSRKSKQRTLRFKNAVIFVAMFGLLFIVYHIPGYNVYGKLMLEDKSHAYEGIQRKALPQSWNELNIYFEAYKDIHGKPNKWAVTFDEVVAFKAKHPELELNLTYTGFVKTYPAIWLKNLTSRVIESAYYAQSGFFFFKYTSINRWVNNENIIKGLAFVIFLIFIWAERIFIRRNAILFLPAIFYYLFLAIYCIPQLEQNWLLWCLPFLALPATRWLCGKVNIWILFIFQAVYIIIIP